MLIAGKASYAMIIGRPRLGYQNGPEEWSFELCIDNKTVKLLREHGLSPKIKNKGDWRGDYIKFTRKAKKRTGEDNTPIQIIDAHGEPWDGKTLIGNGSTLNVLFNINERPGFNGGKPTLAADVLKIQVWDLVPYEKKDPFPRAEGETPVEATSGTDEEWA